MNRSFRSAHCELSGIQTKRYANKYFVLNRFFVSRLVIFGVFNYSELLKNHKLIARGNNFLLCEQRKIGYNLVEKFF